MNSQLNRQIFAIDWQYQKMLKIIISKELINYRGIPIEWEDIYYQFLFQIQKIIFDYDKSIGVPFKTFLGKKCKFFSLNYCRKFTTTKHKILNNYTSYEKNEASFLQDFDVDKPTIDLALFSSIELKVYTKHFLEGFSLMQICEELKFSDYKIRNIIKHIKVKVYSQNKN